MTGYGRAEFRSAEFSVAVEISSVNRKQSDIVVSLPREYSVLEIEVRKIAGENVSRGRVQVQVKVDDSNSGRHAKLAVDVDLAKQYAAALRKLGKELKLGGELTLADLLRAPGIFSTGEDANQATDRWPAIKEAVQKALATFEKSREREGSHLKKDLEQRVRQIRAILKAIVAEAPEVTKYYRENLRRRLADAGLPLPLDDERLLKEIAVYADRCDISEETSRLSGHLDEFGRLLKSSEPQGRAMDFLTQEMNRELNTTGSKGNSTVIAHLVVAGKTEVERVREQVQNVE
jgi:uncharacterized protein (TIGR00255 family)